MALALAAQMLHEDRTSSARQLGRNALMTYRSFGESLSNLAISFADAVRRHGYDDRGAIVSSINKCLLIAFDHTEDGIDLKNDLITPDVEERDFDKYPHWIAGAPVALKLEVGTIMAREGIPEGSQWMISSSGPTAQLVFKLPDGTTRGSWTLSCTSRLLDRPGEPERIMKVGRQNRERAMKRTSTHLTKFPNPSGPPSLPTVARRRPYMAGLGRFLTQARLEERLRGELAYAYANNNPVTLVDPSGLYPKANCPSNRKREGDINRAVAALCTKLEQIGRGSIEASKCLNLQDHLNQAQCMLDWCKVGCVACGNLKECANPRGCAYSYGTAGSWGCIYICPSAWDPSLCSSYSCSNQLFPRILHEMIGLCGSPHDDDSPSHDDPCTKRASCMCHALKL